MSRRSAARIAWSLWALSTALLLGALPFTFLNRSTPTVVEQSGAIFDVVVSIALLTFPTVGALIASRRPENPIGWLFCSVGVPLGLSSFAGGYATYALFTDPGSLPGVAVMAWLASWLFLPAIFAIPPLLFLLFPDGRLPSPRWRPAVSLTIAASVVAAGGNALAPGRLVEPPFESVLNPFGIEGFPSAATVGARVGWLVLVSIVLAAASLILRFRRSSGERRQQIKWIASAGALFALAAGVVMPLTYDLGGPEEIGQAAVLLALPATPVAAGIAILRHRLYDIDVVINRTLVYVSLTAALGLTYAGGVILLGQLFRPLTSGSDLAIAGSTLAVAALFRPLRARIQAAVDRRFYRHKYDASRTLEGFSARLREQVDLDALGGELRSCARRCSRHGCRCGCAAARHG